MSRRITDNDEREFAWGGWTGLIQSKGCWREAIVEDHRTPVAD
jgi:hypothetical protein